MRQGVFGLDLQHRLSGARALGEDADHRPVLTAPRAPRTNVDAVLVDSVEDEHDHHMGEVFQAGQRVGTEAIRIERDGAED